MSSSEFASTVASRLFAPSTAIRADGIYAAPSTEAKSQLAEIRRADSASAYTADALQAIADASLSFEQKDALIKLTAQIDEQQEGNPSYLEDVQTLVAMLEATTSPAQQQAMTVNEARSLYEAEHSFLAQNQGVTLAFSLAFEQTRAEVIAPQNRMQQDFLKAATAQDLAKAVALARDVLGLGVDIFV